MDKLPVLKDKSKIAIIPGAGLGDALLCSVLANNLAIAGHHVTLISKLLSPTQSWFVHFFIKPLSDPQHDLKNFDLLIFQDRAPLLATNPYPQKSLVLDESRLNKKQSLVKNFQDISKKLTNKLAYIRPELKIPSYLKAQSYEKRILIHPTSTSDKKNWLKRRFLKLCQQLKDRGYEPKIIVAPNERAHWKEAEAFLAPNFEQLHDLFCYVYESAALIGNDSGLGHLAALLGLPTLSLFARRSHSLLWRPSWPPSRGSHRVITPLIPLPGSKLKVRYWKYLLFNFQILHQLRYLALPA